MIRYKDFVIIGIDNGYGNNKTANTCTATGIGQYSYHPQMGGEIIEYDGFFYKIGEGHKMFVPDKTADNDFYILTLHGIARELSRGNITSAEVFVAAGLPISWWSNQGDDYEAYLRQNEYVHFKYNDTQFDLHIVGAMILPQGYAAVYDYLGDMIGDNMIADIGNGTINVMRIKNRLAVESEMYTDKMGVNQCVINLSKAINDKCASKVDEFTIEQFVRTGRTTISEKYVPMMKEIARKYCDDVFNILRKYEYNEDFMKLYICGGGARVIEKFYNKLPTDRVVLITDVCAAAKGYEKIALEMLREDAV